jgi:hypothetical protein
MEPVHNVAAGIAAAYGRGGARWFRRFMAGQDAPPHFTSNTEPDGDFNRAVPNPEVVAEAWRVWRAEVAFADRFVADARP